MPLAGCSACLVKGYTEANCVYEGVRCSCGKEEAPTIDISNNGGKYGSCFMGHTALGFSITGETRIRRVWGCFS